MTKIASWAVRRRDQLNREYNRWLSDLANKIEAGTLSSGAEGGRAMTETPGVEIASTDGSEIEDVHVVESGFTAFPGAEDFPDLKVLGSAPCDVVLHANGEAVLTFHSDNTVSFGEHLTPREGAEAAWTKILEFKDQYNRERGE